MQRSRSVLVLFRSIAVIDRGAENSDRLPLTGDSSGACSSCRVEHATSTSGVRGTGPFQGRLSARIIPWNPRSRACCWLKRVGAKHRRGSSRLHRGRPDERARAHARETEESLRRSLEISFVHRLQIDTMYRPQFISSAVKRPLKDDPGSPFRTAPHRE